MRILLAILCLVCFRASSQRFSIDYIPDIVNHITDTNYLKTFIQKKGFKDNIYYWEYGFAIFDSTSHCEKEYIKFSRRNPYSPVELFAYYTDVNETYKLWKQALEKKGYNRGNPFSYSPPDYKGIFAMLEPYTKGDITILIQREEGKKATYYTLFALKNKTPEALNILAHSF